jgi:hypothetical protein
LEAVSSSVPAIPVVPITDDEFVWTSFPNRDWLKTGTRYTGWDNYVRDNLEFQAKAVIAKGARPAIIHGATDGYKKQTSIQSISAIILDCDESPEKPDLSLLPCRHFSQVRWDVDKKTWKWHAVLPLAKPWTIPELAVNQIAARRKIIIDYFSGVFGVKIDDKMASVQQILHPYCRASPEDDLPDACWSDVPFALDTDTILAQHNYRDVRPKLVGTNTPGTPKQKTEFAKALYEAVTKAGLWLAQDGARGRPMQCPFLDEHSSGQGALSSTLMMDSGKIHCMHNACEGRLQPEYHARLPLEAGDFAADIQIQMATSAAQRVSVRAAQAQINAIMRMTEPNRGDAAIIRISTGGGKTHTAAAYLDKFCGDRWDDIHGEMVPGKTAVLASPTNALLRETAERFITPHRVRVGVLAVLNDDGTPACAKYDTAKALQAQGGNVHRLMCAKCEYRETCPARAGATTGEGKLTLTNHTLMPAVVKDLTGSSYPLIVWDECPPMVETLQLKFSDLAWLLERFEEEDRPRRLTFGDVWRVEVFGERYRRCLRPLVEVLRRISTEHGLEDAVAEFAQTRMYESTTSVAAAALGLQLTGTPWERIRELASEARKVHVSETMLDKMHLHDKEAVLKAETMRRAFEAILDPYSHIKRGVGCLEITRLTENGKVWRDHGGVILDATAPMELLKSIRKGKRTMTANLVVEDGAPEETRRFMKPAYRLSKTVLKRQGEERSGKELDKLVADIASSRRDLANALKTEPDDLRFVVFTYRVLVEDIKKRLPGTGWDVWYFGNTKGYDRWYQEGYSGFITVGDPYSNVGADENICEYVGMDQQVYSADAAKAELAQAHGRARDPQQLKGQSRLHIHYGRIVPLGWDVDNCIVTPWSS